ncbi:unnamed protein product [Zymoseptoria tritici ST99CH_1A5]|uniref:Aerobactin siderophore biosynthesis IucA/IucC N-terminal domain-containing protein n=1 Tax=Zymoseptoria tritici ST99CH_1A5 TaxID=1276529 RepID=A0A1Y6L4L0_ZYMTR|nr:unnamed protein product [Zymoseptoria tritici ST99CH_3D1]SMY19367.1 unnamed protein product [Zymoseptoria tritici ST99CH_1A5]
MVPKQNGFAQWPSRPEAAYEINSRLIACFLNEGLLRASPHACIDYTVLASGVLIHSHFGIKPDHQIWIATRGAVVPNKSCWHQSDFALPLILRTTPAGLSDPSNVPVPSEVAAVARRLFTESVDDGPWTDVLVALDNSFENLTAWLQVAATKSRPTLDSRMINWENAVFRGHHLHPMGRALVATGGLKQLDPSQVPSLLQPSITFIAVDRGSTRITGPFRTLLKPLLDQFSLPRLLPNEVVLPCLSQQLPAIQRHFPSTRVLLHDAFTAHAQASLRTVNIPSEMRFAYNMKFALSCTISSVLRTITPWTTCLGPEISAVIEDAVTENTWVCKEVAAITGSQKDFSAAKNLSCILREDLEPRALALGQTLIVVAALAEKPVGSSECLAALTFGLRSSGQKKKWLRDYASKLIHAVLTPALESGVCLEAHGQNSLVRVDKRTKAIVGFCFRDFGSVKCHTPTLRNRGHQLLTVLPACWIETDVEEEGWDTLQHTMIHNHLQLLIRGLNLHPIEAWPVIRRQLDNFFEQHTESESARRMHAYLTRPIVRYKALLRMRMSADPLDDIFVNAPNMLQVGSDEKNRNCCPPYARDEVLPSPHKMTLRDRILAAPSVPA